MNVSTISTTWHAHPGTENVALSGVASAHQAATAFTPVRVRQTFGQPTPSATQSQSYSQYPPHPYGTSYHPAFHAASAQSAQTNPYHSPNPAQEQQSPKKPKMEWPESVRSYVQRSFLESNLDPAVSRKEMETKLKETISSANAGGIMHSIDWSAMPLPQEMIKDERARKMALPPVFPAGFDGAGDHSAVLPERMEHARLDDPSMYSQPAHPHDRDMHAQHARLDDNSQPTYPGDYSQHPPSDYNRHTYSPSDYSQVAYPGDRPMSYAAAVTGIPPPSNHTNSKKRKSTDNFPDDYADAQVPWRAGSGPGLPGPGPLPGGRLQDRITERRDTTDRKSKFQRQMDKRQKRFDGGYKSTWRSPSPPPSNGPVVGTCERLLKSYLRLTAAPNPANVRPERILRQTLVLLKKKWSEEENYPFICDQFKSLRQDLTVQHIKNDFTVEVYECHARIALEKGDLGEYNQCQTQLKAFYKQGLKGNANEFTAYRILYFLHTANRSSVNDIMATLTPTEKKDKGIKHALDVRSALALGNYHRFFRLFAQTPNMGGWLMDMFVVRERLNALCYICKSFKPLVPLRYVTDELFFETDADAAQFILDYDGAELLEEKNGELMFLSGQGLRLFNSHKVAAFARIDIKGQI